MVALYVQSLCGSSDNQQFCCGIIFGFNLSYHPLLINHSKFNEAATTTIKRAEDTNSNVEVVKLGSEAISQADGRLTATRKSSVSSEKSIRLNRFW